MQNNEITIDKLTYDLMEDEIHDYRCILSNLTYYLLKPEGKDPVEYIKHAAEQEKQMRNRMRAKLEYTNYLRQNNLKFDVEKWMEFQQKNGIPENKWKHAKEQRIKNNEPLRG